VMSTSVDTVQTELNNFTLLLNIKGRKCQSIATIYIMINFIWLHVSTRNESSSGHKLKWPEGDSLRVETCSHMKGIIIRVYIYVYIVAID
jgi:hypothetical protein